MMILHDAITAVKRQQAASADVPTIQLTDFFEDVKITIVTKIVTETPLKNALTNDICSATATK